MDVRQREDHLSQIRRAGAIGYDHRADAVASRVAAAEAAATERDATRVLAMTLADQDDQAAMDAAAYLRLSVAYQEFEADLTGRISGLCFGSDSGDDPIRFRLEAAFEYLRIALAREEALDHLLHEAASRLMNTVTSGE